MRADGGDDPVTVEGLIMVRETDAAWGCATDPLNMRTIDVWLPKSLVEAHTLEYLKAGMAVIPRWLAEAKELEYDE